MLDLPPGLMGLRFNCWIQRKGNRKYRDISMKFVDSGPVKIDISAKQPYWFNCGNMDKVITNQLHFWSLHRLENQLLYWLDLVFEFILSQSESELRTICTPCRH